ncbi:hypothetical protein HHK36_026426 [Tetracentron sinense]|uniref:Bet v I/Major latex protein domain-containing protein n=1 Tax=Tetracentron sinense TaxID=13715 RepID=A0A834YLE0_TETSI|nr:hypothetical protein HHK36_026426 [Tetracentron sinense]
MGVTSFAQEFESPIAPARMFKALILDSDNLSPKLMPHSIKSIDTIQGDGGVGSIKQLNFTEGSHFKYMKHRIDKLDKENFVCKYTLIEGDILGENLKSIAYEVTFEAYGDGGCIFKMLSEYHTEDDVEYKEEDIEFGKEKAMGMYKVMEAYLLANPDAYA